MKREGEEKEEEGQKRAKEKTGRINTGNREELRAVVGELRYRDREKKSQ